MNKKPLILITNDDGSSAKGIFVLSQLMKQLGDVVVVAPDGARSAQSNALTIHQPIRYKKLEEQDGITIYNCTGTPSDCVKLALNVVLQRKPDVLVSGINHGSNSAVNVIYSGTMGAVLEGCAHDIPSIGFSLCDFDEDADFTPCEPYILQLVRRVLQHGLSAGTCLNVNFPKGDIKGLRLTRQCKGHWVKEFAESKDPRNGGSYYWLTGHFQNDEPNAEDTDEYALKNGYASMVPTKVDMTDYNAMAAFGEMEF